MNLIRQADVKMLHPKFGGSVAIMQDRLINAFQSGETKSFFYVFETIRSPYRQSQLFEEGTSKEREWQSAHQYGLAVDFAAKRGGVWSWDEAEDWNFLATVGTEFKLRSFKNFIGHFESPIWSKIKDFVI